MTPQTAAPVSLEALEQKWSREADELELIAPSRSERLHAEGLRQCADELATLRATLAQHEVVAWQYRLTLGGIFSSWRECSQEFAEKYIGAEGHEFRELRASAIVEAPNCARCDAGEAVDVMGFHRDPRAFVECPKDAAALQPPSEVQ